jgi:hypothetical protein
VKHGVKCPIRLVNSILESGKLWTVEIQFCSCSYSALKGSGGGNAFELVYKNVKFAQSHVTVAQSELALLPELSFHCGQVEPSAALQRTLHHIQQISQVRELIT